MMKLALAAVASIVVASPALAEPFSGGYVGAGATMDNIQGSGAAEGIGFSGAGATAFAGYDVSFGGTFTGIEANVDLNTADAFGINAKWGRGVSGRFGVKLSETTGAYGRLGYQRNKIGGGGASAWGDGVRMGAGVETGISSNASLRFEFNHVNYEDDLINNQAAVAVLFRF